MDTIGEKIKKARKASNLTQTELAKRLGVSQQMIAAYENGKRNPKAETLLTIATALNVPVFDLIEPILDPSLLDFTIEDFFSGKFPTSRYQTPIQINDDIKESLDSVLTESVKKLLDKLNDLGKEEALKRVQELTEIPKYQKDSEKKE